MSDFSKSHVSGHDNWSTPDDLYNSLDDEFHFTDDPCPLYGFSDDSNGLIRPWGSSVFMNPPYSRGQMKLWCEKAYHESLKGSTVVGLLRGDTSTAWFHDWVLGKAELRFIRGRIKFGGSKNAPPFPSIIAIWRPYP